MHHLDIIGLKVSHRDGISGVIVRLHPNQPWCFSVTFDDNVTSLQSIVFLRFGDLPLSDYLLAQNITLDRETWSALARRSKATVYYTPSTNPSDLEMVCKHEADEGQRHIGSVKWFGGNNSKTGEINEYGFITTPMGEDIFFHQAHVLCSVASLREGIQVSFCYEQGRRGLHATKVRILNKEGDLQHLQCLFLAEHGDARRPALQKLVLLLLPRELVAFALENLEELEQSDCYVIYKALAPSTLLTLETSQLRSRLPPEARLTLFAHLDDIAHYMDEVIDAIKSDGAGEKPSDDHLKFWAKHGPRDPESPLYPFAPLELRRQVWRDKILPYLPINVRIAGICREKGKLQARDWADFVLGLLQRVDAGSEAKQILHSVPATLRLEFFTTLNDLAPYKEDVIEALGAVRVEIVPDIDVIQSFWRKHCPSVPEDFLYPHAPEQVQHEIWFTKVLPLLPIEDQLSAVRNKKERFQRHEWLALTQRIAKDSPQNPDVKHLLSVIPPGIRMEFFASLNSLDVYLEEIIQALKAAANGGASQTTLGNFWLKHPPPSPKHRLYKHAPADVKRSACQKYYAVTTRLLADLFQRDEKIRRTWSALDVYKNLTANDRKVASLWGKTEKTAIMAQMLSARAAEKVAATFYRGLWALGGRYRCTPDRPIQPGLANARFAVGCQYCHRRKERPQPDQKQELVRGTYGAAL